MGASREKTTRENESALSIAVRYNQPSVVLYLLTSHSLSVGHLELALSQLVK